VLAPGVGVVVEKWAAILNYITMFSTATPSPGGDNLLISLDSHQRHTVMCYRICLWSILSLQ